MSCAVSICHAFLQAATSTAWPSMSGNRRTLGAGKSSEPRAVPRRISADDCSPSGTLSSSAAPSASSRTASGGLQPGNAAPKRGTGSSRPGAASSQHGNSRISKMSPTGSSASASGSSMQRRTFSQDGPPSGRQAGTGGGRLARLTEGSKMSQQNSPKGSTSPTKASIRQSAMASGAKSATASRRTTTSNR
uniref:Uncharacterized protein n=1 Tax=Tetraselmis sp. GSL018 TaxID=582737 RepID=A0A061RJH9_9CHLO